MRKFLLTATAIGALASASAIAQDDKMNSATQPGAMGANPSPGAAANPTPTMPADGPNFVQVQNTDMLSSNVVGLDVFNAQQTKVGKI